MMRILVLILAALLLNGCDKLAGLIDSKVADAQAIGAACRLAQKQPSVCMTENPKQSPAYILAGWKKTDDDIKNGVVDPSMSNAVRAKEEDEDKSKDDDEDEDKGRSKDKEDK
jgi:hypothetical protein